MNPAHRTHLTLLSVCLLLLLSGCKSANPVGAAQTPEQKAYAAYGTFVIFQERAVAIAQQPNIPNNVKRGVIDAENRAKPIADNLVAAMNEYLQIQAQVAAGTTPQEKLVIASNNLNNWVTQLAPLVNDLITNVKGASQ